MQHLGLVSGRQLVVAALLLDDLHRPQRVLAARRSTPVELRGRWEFPGGKVEPGEDVVTALVREIAEELDLAVEVGAELVDPEAACWPISAAYELRCWFAHIVAGTPRAGHSHDATGWVRPGDLATMDWLDADRPVAAELLRQWASSGAAPTVASSGAAPPLAVTTTTPNHSNDDGGAPCRPRSG